MPLEAENFPWLEPEGLKGGVKGEVREIPSVRSVQPAVTVSEILGPIYNDWREALGAKGIPWLTTRKEMGTSDLQKEETGFLQQRD